MTTIEVGQLVLDVETQRVWKLIQRDQYTDTNWIIELINDPLGTRSIGDRSLVRESWIERRCIDHSTAADPPMGDGPQACRIAGWDMVLVTTAEDAVAWFTEHLDRGDQGEWFGWDAGASFGSLPPPDMTVTWNEAGDQLVWANASS